MQTKKGSFIEACINTFIGFVVSLAANPIACWLFNVQMKAHQMAEYVLFFTILSVIRSYVIRRFFNRIIIRTANRINGTGKR